MRLGQLAAEYESQPVAGPPCLTCYLSYDHLGSVTLVTDQNGNAVARHDYAPFGQEVPGGSAGRSALFGSTTDVDPKFTGQLRDTETNEDYFNARYHFAQQMRFMSPDPANAGADITNPQSWNAYAYVLGNPLGMVDPSGMDEVNYSGIPNGGCPANHQGSDFCGSVSTGPFSPMPPGVYDASLAILPTGASPGTPPPTSPAAGSALTTPAKNGDHPERPEIYMPRRFRFLRELGWARMVRRTNYTGRAIVSTTTGNSGPSDRCAGRYL